MKICLYLEFYHFLGGILFKNIGTGLLSSYRNQKKMLEDMGIPYVEKWDDSCDILQINTPWLKSLWLIGKARRQGKKIIIWSHVTAEDFREVFRLNKYVAPLVKKYLTYAYGRADLVFAPSEYTKSLLVAYGLPPEKIVPVSNGVDTDKFRPDAERRRDYREKFGLKGLAVGTVALVVPRKGTGTFLDLAGQFESLQFVWFGKIYSRLMAESLPKNLPKNARFAGYAQDVVAAFNCLDVFLFPSREENQGMVLLEAAAVGLPMLVRDIPVYRGWLIHGENCLKAKTEEEFGKYLDMLLKDPALRDKLAKNALALGQRESLKNLAEKIRKIYDDLLAA